MNPEPPELAKLGDIEFRLGTGGAVIVNVRAEVAPTPGVYTVTPAVLVVPISDARIEHCNWPLLTYVVVRLDPFHRITEFVANTPP
jgi:hypothetical protein